MTEDLLEFPKHDNTLVGQKGITLSGGQRARLALARALYSNSDIYLLDDPLSAVDSQVGRKIFYDSILYLRSEGKTVILVSHQIDYMLLCDRVAILDEGTVVA